MGYYIETGGNLNKARIIAETYDGEVLNHVPESWESIPRDQALIVVVSNGAFEAAGVAYDKREFDAFLHPADGRYKQYVLIPKASVLHYFATVGRPAPQFE